MFFCFYSSSNAQNRRRPHTDDLVDFLHMKYKKRSVEIESVPTSKRIQEIHCSEGINCKELKRSGYHRDEN